MAANRKRRPENAAGAFYVDSTCIDYDQCRLLDFEWVLPGHGWRFQAPAPEMRHQVEACLADMESTGTRTSVTIE